MEKKIEFMGVEFYVKNICENFMWNYFENFPNLKNYFQPSTNPLNKFKDKRMKNQDKKSKISHKTFSKLSHWKISKNILVTFVNVPNDTLYKIRSEMFREAKP